MSFTLELEATGCLLDLGGDNSLQAPKLELDHILSLSKDGIEDRDEPELYITFNDHEKEVSISVTGQRNIDALRRYCEMVLAATKKS